MGFTTRVIVGGEGEVGDAMLVLGFGKRSRSCLALEEAEMGKGVLEGVD